MIVLDASVVLAAALGEPEQDAIELLIEDQACAISTVNAAEVVGKLIDLGVREAEAVEVLSLYRLRQLPFDTHTATATALLRPATRAAGLSLGDRACLATAGLHDAIAFTTDRAWRDLDVDIDVRCLRD